MLDANVALDAFQQRAPHQKASAHVLSKSLNREIDGCFPAHVVTTVYYILRKSVGSEKARESIGWLVGAFEIAPCDSAILKNAVASEITDFEDAVAAFSALQTGCDLIVTRNVQDFDKSPVTAISPAALIQRLSES